MLRKLSKSEIETLLSNGCSATDWDNIEVSERFTPSLVENCRFEGKVQIGENVTLRNIHQSVSNYIIEDNATISNVDSLVTNGVSTFGNGTLVSVLNEAGGREVPIFEELSSQIAYIVAMYRHRPKTISAISGLIENFTQAAKSEMGVICSGATIKNCGDITNVKIGANVAINGALELSNGTVGAQSQIGRGVIMRNFITASSSKITDGAIIEKCFIGQGCEIGRGFSAENSLFFANCVCMNGEACSIFAAPYTVTHHKSTLLIGGMFSFYNAGSATNQSNHYYRLGPLHQGILERGCKTASSSYILFPAHIGAFSIVKGRHNKNIDTSHLPFSYIIESNGESVIIPAANLTNVGTARDESKWRARDNRQSDKRLDIINFEMFSPYTVSKIIDATAILETLSIENGEYISYSNAKIARKSIAKAIKTYNLAIDCYTGAVLAHNLQQGEIETNKKYYSEWVDLGGMIAPNGVINQLLDRVESCEISSIEQLSHEIEAIANNYSQYEWEFVVNVIADKLGKPTKNLTAADLRKVLQQWKTSVATLTNLIMADAQKEFSEDMKISYSEDFEAVRGTAEDNSFLKKLSQQTIEKCALADKIIATLND